jgi:hypothetical protein
MNLNSIWSVLEESFDILGDYGYPAIDKVADELDLEPGYFTWLAAIWLFGSETITTAKYMRMFSYGLARVNNERFASAVRKGYLVSDGKDGYVPTEEGLNVARKMWRVAGDSLADLSPLSDEYLQRLFSYFDRLIDASLSAPEPPAHFYISHKRDNYGRYGTECPLEDFVVRFGALAAYRDDAHLATWQAHEIEGHAWEILTYLWRSASAASVEQLFEKVEYRGIPKEIYFHDLQKLCERDWVAENAGEYQLTAEGKRIRDEAEGLTDCYFFIPWTCLSEAELEDLLSWATQLRDGIRSSS